MNTPSLHCSLSYSRQELLRSPYIAQSSFRLSKYYHLNELQYNAYFFSNTENYQYL